MGLIKSIFGSRKKNNSSLEVDAVIDKIHRFVTDENVQNEMMSESLKQQLSEGIRCDEIPGSTGDFGHTFSNPIPVNGPVGEAVYLKELITNHGQPIMFQRLGSLGNIDVYETVSFDGQKWDILFFDFYHPRKSRKIPKGYKHSYEAKLFYGTNVRVRCFPDDLCPAIADFTKRILGMSMMPRQVRLAIEKGISEMPEIHKINLQKLETIGLSYLSFS